MPLFQIVVLIKFCIKINKMPHDKHRKKANYQEEADNEVKGIIEKGPTNVPAPVPPASRPDHPRVFFDITIEEDFFLVKFFK